MPTARCRRVSGQNVYQDGLSRKHRCTRRRRRDTGDGDCVRRLVKRCNSLCNGNPSLRCCLNLRLDATSPRLWGRAPNTSSNLTGCKRFCRILVSWTPWLHSGFGEPPIIERSPPSTRTTSPVMKEAWSERRNATRFATSSARAGRPSG